MNLNISNPIAFFDLETTGVDVTSDRIVEISILKLHPDGKTENYTKKVNPEMDIPLETSKIHGIYKEDVKDAPKFSEICVEISNFIGGSDLAGYNSNKFDIPVLAEEFLRVNSDFDMSSRKFIDVQNIFHKMEQRTLVAAYKFYCDKDLTNAHSAEADTLATYEVLLAQVEKYDELENTTEFLSEFSRQGKHKPADFAGRLAYNDKGELIYNFGKQKGKTIKEVSLKEPGYYGWMLTSNFPLYTKQVLKKEMAKIKAEREVKKTKAKEVEANKMSNKLDALKNKFGK